MKNLLKLLLVLTALPLVAQVTTRSGDNNRTGVFQSKITVAGLTQNGIRLRTTVTLAGGDARGAEGQPLVNKAGVMYVASMANTVQAVDSHTGAEVWRTTLGRPVDGDTTIDMHRINKFWGILSTPVYDQDTNRLYLVDWESPDGTPQAGVHWMYALDGATGKVLNKVSFAGLPNYGQTKRKARSSLALATLGGRKTVLGAWGTVQETGRYASGSVFAYDVATNTLSNWYTTAGRGGGVWMGGQGVIVDENGTIIFSTGNGSFNGTTDFGESTVALNYRYGSGFKEVGHFTPYSDSGRIGLDPTKSDVPSALANNQKPAGVSAITEEIKPVGGGMDPKMVMGGRAVADTDANTGALVVRVYPTNPTDPGWSDEDFGSGGCTRVAKYKKVACGGKDGILYVVDTTKWPNTMPADLANPGANCRKLASYPIWATSSPGRDVDTCPTNTTDLNFMPWGKTRHLHSTPVQYWEGDTLYLFIGGENSAVHKWRMDPNGTMTYIAETKEVASVESTRSPGGMPGSFLAIGTDNWKPGTSVLWVSYPYGDANSDIVNGRLVAYDPKTMAVLWDSQRWGIAYPFNKFMSPTLYDNEVLLPNYGNGVMIFY